MIFAIFRPKTESFLTNLWPDEMGFLKFIYYKQVTTLWLQIQFQPVTMSFTMASYNSYCDTPENHRTFKHIWFLTAQSNHTKQKNLNFQKTRQNQQ